MYSPEQISKIKFNMTAFGGGFVVALAAAMHRADKENLERLVKAFPEYMDKYLNFGE